ncbi:MAG: RluA family pseudouridine synthase [Eubacteriales bacterium]
MEITIGKDAEGITLSDYLTGRMRLSHKAISRLKRLENGMVLDGRRVTVRAILHEGGILSLALEDEKSSDGILPVCLPLDILFEDRWLIAVNKPPDMPTHPSHGHFDDTLANALAYYFSEKGQPFVFRAINRLDRDTSGVVLIAKDGQTAAKLAGQMESGGIRKQYLALLCGILEPPCGRIENYIRRVADSIITREVTEQPLPDASAAITEYRRLAVGPSNTLVAACPMTGRTHQLRVHFSHLGHPIVGDSLYGKPDKNMDRQALHAHTLTFTHPFTGEKMRLAAPLPSDLTDVCQAYGIKIPDTAAFPTD